MALGVNMTMSKHSEETTRQTFANMQLTENKQKSKRKGEARDLCCAWECSDTESRINDDNAFHRCQKNRQKCSYLDERNIILSPHLFAQPKLCVSRANDASDGANSRWKPSEITHVPTKSASPDVKMTSERPGAPDPSCVPINPSVSSDSMTQRQNIVSENSPQVHIVEVNRILPMIEWIPQSSQEQTKEETTAWRCAEFVLDKREAVWKKTSEQKLEWCHEHLAKTAHLGPSSPANSPPSAVRQSSTAVVIRRVRGYRGSQVKASHGERRLKPLANHKDLHNSYCSPSTPQNPYECLCSPVQPRLRCSPGGDQQDGTLNTDRKQQRQKREFSVATGDMLCQSRWPKNAESPPAPHHVTFSHILKVLQSKPGNFPEIKGLKCHRAV